VGGPPDRRDRRDAETLVDLGPVRVVDTGDDVLDAERLAHHPGREDVRVVAVGDRGERERVLDPRLAQRVAVEPEAGDLVPAELRVQASERLGVLVDDGHRVAVVLEALRQRRTDPAASHDHEVHSAARYTVRVALAPHLRRA
jgi:hypothetical protein